MSDPLPGTHCECGGTLLDPEENVVQGGHPGGGDAEYVGSGPVTLRCDRCGARVPTSLRRTQYFDGSKTSYS